MNIVQISSTSPVLEDSTLKPPGMPLPSGNHHSNCFGIASSQISEFIIFSYYIYLIISIYIYSSSFNSFRLLSLIFLLPSTPKPQGNTQVEFPFNKKTFHGPCSPSTKAWWVAWPQAVHPRWDSRSHCQRRGRESWGPPRGSARSFPAKRAYLTGLV